MSDTPSQTMPKGYYKSNKEIYYINTLCYKISNDMTKEMAKETVDVIDPEFANPYELNAIGFAYWLKKAYEASRFKSLTELAEAVGFSKATISRLMSASPQTLTGKPSQPRIGLVMRLAEVLGADENEGMFYAGFSAYGRPYKKPQNVAEFVQQLSEMGFDIRFSSEDLEGMGPDDMQDIIDQIESNILVKSRRRKQR